MKSEDTVMSDTELMSWHFKSLESRQRIAQAQAEISFKAGIVKGLQLANQVGLNHFIGDFTTGEHHPTCQACKLLKEWGIIEVTEY